jgi:hypothetical protein
VSPWSAGLRKHCCTLANRLATRSSSHVRFAAEIGHIAVSQYVKRRANRRHFASRKISKLFRHPTSGVVGQNYQPNVITMTFQHFHSTRKPTLAYVAVNVVKAAGPMA